VGSLGQEIRSRRLARGLTLREFARRVGVTPPYVTDLEADRRRPGPEVLARIARELATPVEQLQALDTRLRPEVRRWVESEPEVGQLLRRLKDSPRRDAVLRGLRRLIDEEGAEPPPFIPPRKGEGEFGSEGGRGNGDHPRKGEGVFGSEGGRGNGDHPRKGEGEFGSARGRRLRRGGR